MWRSLSYNHVGHHYKGQDAHYHQSHGDHDDRGHHSVVAIIGLEHSSHSTSHPVRRSAHIHDCSRTETFLCSPNWQNCALLTEAACCRSILEDQLAFAAHKAHRLSPLHLGWKLAENVLVVTELGQISAVPDFRQLTAHGARQLLDLHRRDVDASQALQAKRVAAGEQLWSLKDIVVVAEADGTLRFF